MNGKIVIIKELNQKRIVLARVQPFSIVVAKMTSCFRIIDYFIIILQLSIQINSVNDTLIHQLQDVSNMMNYSMLVY